MTALQGPFAGLRVLELTSTVAGPFCGRLFADFGAEVIKIEPADGDAIRSMGSHSDGKSLYAASMFRNKRLVALDLRRPEIQEIVRRIAATCDVFVENFRPGTMERWGLGYDRLSAINPRLVMVRISGFGQTGPYSARPGYGVTSEAVSGLRELTGDPDRPPARIATSLTDYITGLYAGFGASMALMERQRTGRGQVVDTALYESAFSFTEPHVPAFAKLGMVATRTGSRLPGHTPNNLYPTGDGRYIHITAASQTIFARLMVTMDRPELIDDRRFATHEARVENQDAIDAIIGAWTAGLPTDRIEALLAAGEVPSARVYTMAEIFGDPHYRARDMLVELPDRELGSVTVAGIVPKLSATPGGLAWAGRRIGEDTRAVLEGVAGLTGEEVDALERAGAVHCAPPPAPPAADLRLCAGE